MYRIVEDEQVFTRFWEAEREFPRHWTESNNVWGTTLEDYIGFCDDCFRVYLVDDNALLFAQKVAEGINIHLSLIRGTDPMAMIEDFIKIRGELLTVCQLIFGWVYARNRGLKSVLKAVGFKDYGVRMYTGTDHKVFEWQLFSATRDSVEKRIASVEQTV